MLTIKPVRVVSFCIVQVAKAAKKNDTFRIPRSYTPRTSVPPLSYWDLIWHGRITCR